MTSKFCYLNSTLRVWGAISGATRQYCVKRIGSRLIIYYYYYYFKFIFMNCQIYRNNVRQYFLLTLSLSNKNNIDLISWTYTELVNRRKWMGRQWIKHVWCDLGTNFEILTRINGQHLATKHYNFGMWANLWDLHSIKTCVLMSILRVFVNDFQMFRYSLQT